jgi:hypothetical protein
MEVCFLAYVTVSFLTGCNSDPASLNKGENVATGTKKIYIHFDSENETLVKSAPMKNVHFDKAKKLYFVQNSSGKATLFIHRQTSVSSELILFTDEKIVGENSPDWQIEIDKYGKVLQSPIGYMIRDR